MKHRIYHGETTQDDIMKHVQSFYPTLTLAGISIHVQSCYPTLAPAGINIHLFIYDKQKKSIGDAVKSNGMSDHKISIIFLQYLQSLDICIYCLASTTNIHWTHYHPVYCIYEFWKCAYEMLQVPRSYMFDAIPSWFGTFFIGDFFIEMLLRPLLEDACPALLLGTLLTVRPPCALLLGTFLTTRLPQPRPRPTSASSSVLLGESPLTGDTSWLDLVCITRNRCLVIVEKEERVGDRQPTSYLHR